MQQPCLRLGLPVDSAGGGKAYLLGTGEQRTSSTLTWHAFTRLFFTKPLFSLLREVLMLRTRFSGREGQLLPFEKPLT